MGLQALEGVGVFVVVVSAVAEPARMGARARRRRRGIHRRERLGEADGLVPVCGSGGNAGLAVGGYRGERLRQADPLVAFGALGRRRLPTAGRIGALGFVCCVFGHRMST